MEKRKLFRYFCLGIILFYTMNFIILTYKKTDLTDLIFLKKEKEMPVINKMSENQAQEIIKLAGHPIEVKPLK